MDGGGVRRFLGVGGLPCRWGSYRGGRRGIGCAKHRDFIVKRRRPPLVSGHLGFESLIASTGFCKGLRQLPSEGRSADAVFRSRSNEVSSFGRSPALARRFVGRAVDAFHIGRFVR